MLGDLAKERLIDLTSEVGKVELIEPLQKMLLVSLQSLQKALFNLLVSPFYLNFDEVNLVLILLDTVNQSQKLLKR